MLLFLCYVRTCEIVLDRDSFCLTGALGQIGEPKVTKRAFNRLLTCSEMEDRCRSCCHPNGCDSLRAGWCAFTVAAAAPKTYLGVSGISFDYIPFWYAKDYRLYQKYNVDVDMITTGGGTVLAQAMLSGGVHFAAIGTAFLQGAMQGADHVLLAAHVNYFPYRVGGLAFYRRQGGTQEARRSRSAVSVPTPTPH